VSTQQPDEFVDRFGGASVGCGDGVEVGEGVCAVEPFEDRELAGPDPGQGGDVVADP